MMGANSGENEKWSASEYILKVEHIGYSDVVEVECEKNVIQKLFP